MAFEMHAGWVPSLDDPADSAPMVLRTRRLLGCRRTASGSRNVEQASYFPDKHSTSQDDDSFGLGGAAQFQVERRQGQSAPQREFQVRRIVQSKAMALR